MKLEFKDIKNIHKNVPAIIAAHGPSLNLHKEQITKAHQNKKVVRFSVNNWWDYFDESPDYWVLSTGVFTIEKVLSIINEHQITTFYSDDADFTSKDFINKNVKSDWLVYDQRHWKGKTCLEILKDIKKHFETNKDFNFSKYGNNTSMWQPPRNRGHWGHCITNDKCCQQNSPPRTPIQEHLQNFSGHSQHYSTGDSVSLHAIAFAIIMGCNPIYISGLDLDYRKGYAIEEPSVSKNKFKTDWKHNAQGPNAFTPLRQNFLNDLDVLNDSAKLCGLEIINLNPNPWYQSFAIGDFKI